MPLPVRAITARRGNRRCRKPFGSQRRACSVGWARRPSQAISSLAIPTMRHGTRYWLNVFNGRSLRPVSFASRIRSSARARRTMTRIQSGQPVRSSNPVSSTAPAPWRGSPSAPWSIDAISGWNPKPRLNVGRASSFSKCAVISVASRSTSRGPARTGSRRGVFASERPRGLSRRSPGGPNGFLAAGHVCCQRGDGAGDRRIRRDLPVDGRLRAERVAAEGEADRRVADHLCRVMPRSYAGVGTRAVSTVKVFLRRE